MLSYALLSSLLARLLSKPQKNESAILIIQLTTYGRLPTPQKALSPNLPVIKNFLQKILFFITISEKNFSKSKNET
jgi:hypothetical protein